MDKLKDGIKPGYFLIISNWVGYSDKPGSTGMFLYPDGKYTIKDSYLNLRNLDKSHREIISINEGVISQEELENVKKFIVKNITTSSTKMITDCGHSVELIKNESVIRIENDSEVYDTLSKLLGFREKRATLRPAVKPGT